MQAPCMCTLFTYPRPNPVTSLPPSPSRLATRVTSGTHHQENHARTRRLRRSRPPKSGSSGPRTYNCQGLRRPKNGVWLWRTIQTFNECGWQPPCTLAARLVSPRCHHRLRPRTTTACTCCPAVNRHSTSTTHSHRHWPPCLPQSLPPLSPSRSKPLQAQKQPPPRCSKLRSSRLLLPQATRSTMNSSGRTPRSRTLPGDRRLSRRTQRYISPEKERTKKRRKNIEGNTMSTGHPSN